MFIQVERVGLASFVLFGFEMTCAFGVEMNALQSRYVFGKNCRTFFVFNDTPLPLLIKKKKKMKILFLDGHAKKKMERPWRHFNVSKRVRIGKPCGTDWAGQRPDWRTHETFPSLPQGATWCCCLESCLKIYPPSALSVREILSRTLPWLSFFLCFVFSHTR